MKVFAILALAAGAYAKTDQEKCKSRIKGGHTVSAIEEFCAKTNMVVPSTYAQTGHGSGDMKVGITGHCSPAQWVPQEYCLSQLYNMCATSSDDKGRGVKNYGKNGCQSFWISGSVNP